MVADPTSSALNGLTLPDSARVFRTREADDARSRVARVFCDHRLRVLDHDHRVDASMHYLPLGTTGVGIGIMSYGASVEIDVASLTDFILVQMPLRGREWVEYRGGQIHSDIGCASVVGCNGPLHMCHEAGTDKLFIRIRRAVLELHCRQLLGSQPRAPIEFQLGMRLADKLSASWCGLLRWLYGEVSQQGCDGLLGSPLFAAQIEHSLVTALLLSQPNNYSDRLHRVRTAALPQSLRRAEQFVDQHAHEPISVGDIAEAAGLSARALFVSFNRYRDTTPMRYLKDVRLARAREELRSAASSQDTVTAIAMRWGFSHLGHFAADFKARFGELPSALRER